MKKRLVALVSLALSFAVFHACKWLPTELEVKMKPNINIPINSDSADISVMIADLIQNAMVGKNADITILDYLGEMHGGKEIQTFLVHYPVLKDIDAGLQNQFTSMDAFNFSMEEQDFSPNLDIDNLDILNNALPPIDDIDLSLDTLFDNIQSEINKKFEGQSVLTFPLPIFGGGIVIADEYLTIQTLSLTILDQVEFRSGKITTKITMKGNRAGVNVGLKEIRADDHVHPAIVCTDEITLGAFQEWDYIEFDVSGKTLNKDFDLIVCRYIDNSTPGIRSVQLEIEPIQVTEFQCKKVIGLQVASTDVSPDDDIVVPVDIPGSGFVHAEIGDGFIDFIPDIPDDHHGWTTSYFKNFDYELAIDIIQENSLPDSDGNRWPGLNGNTYPNLNGGPYSSLAVPTPRKITSTSFSLNDMHINTRDLTILKSTKVGLSSTRGEFWLTEEDLDAGKITLKVNPQLQINRFKWVHVDIGAQLATLTPSVPPVPLDAAAESLKSITFSRVGPILRVGKMDIPGLEIMVHEPILGINMAKTYSPIVVGFDPNKYISLNKTVVFKDALGNPVVTELDFEVDIRLIGGKKVLAIGDLDPSDPHFDFEISVGFVADWTQVEVDLDKFGAFKGSFPAEDEPAFDLPEIKQYLQGFQFEGIETQLYISGPAAFFDLKPNVKLNLDYKDESNNPVSDPIINITSSDTIESAKVPNLDPARSGKYRGALPAKGISVPLNRLLNNPPSSMRFSYELSLETLIVTPEMIDNITDFNDPLSVEVLVKVPLRLQSGTSGAAIALPDMFKDKTDLFDREKPAEGELQKLQINSLSLKVVLNDEVFSGGHIYLDDRASGGRDIAFDLSGKALGLAITGSDLAYISDTVPYKPEIGLRFPANKTIQIVRGLAAVGIELKADMSFKTKIDDLFKGKK